jgi:muramoyltetrapeptide carboxypeptidase
MNLTCQLPFDVRRWTAAFRSAPSQAWGYITFRRPPGKAPANLDQNTSFGHNRPHELNASAAAGGNPLGLPHQRGRIVAPEHRPTRVGIFAASSVVPEIEFRAGIDHLKKAGFEPIIHQQVLSSHFTFAGDDAARAGAVYDFANDPDINILWAARGGYGAGRLLPILEKLTDERGAPPQGKLLIGYSDVTVLHEFVRAQWNWSTLHAPMPAESGFPRLKSDEWQATVAYARGHDADAPWSHHPLAWLTDPPPADLRAELIGGNLSLWAALAGTCNAPSARGKFIFLEDVGEKYYRIDRMMIQLEQSGAFDGAAAIVLGDFADCTDDDNTCLADAATGARKPLRRRFDQTEAFDHIFTALGRRLGLAIAQGLGVGHGPHFSPLPLGATYHLAREGSFKLLNWQWLKGYGAPAAPD